MIAGRSRKESRCLTPSLYSNAEKWDDLGGDFSSHILGLGPIGSIQYDTGYVGERPIRVFQIYPGTLGKGTTYGYVHLGTNTPSTGRLSDAFDDMLYKFRSGMRDFCGCRL